MMLGWLMVLRRLLHFLIQPSNSRGNLPAANNMIRWRWPHSAEEVNMFRVGLPGWEGANNPLAAYFLLFGHVWIRKRTGKQEKNRKFMNEQIARMKNT
jgi:hypothetical protein